MLTFLTALVPHLQDRFSSDEEGAAMVEYGLLVALIAVVVMAALTPLGGAIAGMFQSVTGNIPAGTP